MTVSTTQRASRYLVRLQVRLGKRLSTDDTSLTAMVDGREVSIASRYPNTPVSSSDWLVLVVRGFSSERRRGSRQE